MDLQVGLQLPVKKIVESLLLMTWITPANGLNSVFGLSSKRLPAQCAMPIIHCLLAEVQYPLILRLESVLLAIGNFITMAGNILVWIRHRKLFQIFHWLEMVPQLQIWINYSLQKEGEALTRTS
jgi:hypothetical protein